MTQVLNQRRRQLIDRPVQGMLLLRACYYWGLTLGTQITVMILLTLSASPPGESYVAGARFRLYLRLMFVASVIILPVILLDLVRLSHRWAGPIYRLRTALNALSRGETVSPIRFRDGDCWQELAGDFNVIAAELSRLRAASPDAATQRIPPSELAPATDK